MAERYPANWVDVWTLALTIIGEASGETHLGRIAVGWDIRNRATIARRFFADHDRKHPLFGDGTLRSACLMPAQFSCWNSDSKRLPFLHALELPKALENAEFQPCLTAALTVVCGLDPDPTNGSTHYHTVEKPVWAKTWPPEWAEGKVPVGAIGRHVFYNDIS